MRVSPGICIIDLLREVVEGHRSVLYNWLQVLGATELAQIDQRVGQQLHAIVPLLDTFKAEQ